ncbi:uncharacterized protein LOC114518928 isoform X3 [Dendronephthya gigantea]|uniref:uncharacterized protein LOC114518928 isoform X3 n=1 Tax=Dendronephthya gigantea TaxID=151771 RepID=UPI00106BEE45|nr:uncharacterized protein LOC114518928 isoform X3 [Dendronephthya gigantea]
MNVEENGHVLDLDLCKLEKSKKYKEQKLKEIISAICAMLNTYGGKVVLYNELKCALAEHSPLVVRILEQSMISIIGVNQTVSNISFQKKNSCLVISVKKVDYLITTNYHLYLPSETQVAQVSPLESLKYVKDIINNKGVSERLEHEKQFKKSQNCDFQQNKSRAFKYLKADQSKCTTLADRMTGKSNKFSCYVSAFANYRGGHIYYGIRDDGIVEGEVVPNEEDKHDITMKVQKTINKMIWPEKIGQPKRVIYIAHCPGGVFTKEPECYEMVEGRVEMMSFIAWEKRVREPVWLFCVKEVSPVSSITWSSVKARKAFTETHKVLMPLINNGHWKTILGKSASLQETSGLCSIRISILSKEITACIRRGRLYKAGKLLQKYKEILSKRNEDSFIFEVIGLYLEAALKRARGDKTGGVREILADALSKAELIEPGVVTATVYVFAAGTVLNDPKNLDYSPDILSARALEHLQHVSDSPELVSNLRKKACFILAASHLGCSINGQRNKKKVDRSGLDKTKSIIMSVHETILEGNPLSKYHEIQFNLVQSIYHYRHSQVNPEERTRLLTIAFNHAKEAECLAKENKFPEMVEWSRANKALFTEELLVRTKLSYKHTALK